MEDVASAAFWVAIVASGVASACFWAHLLSVRLVMRRLPALSYAEGATRGGQGPVVATFERNGGATGLATLGRYGTFATWIALAALAVSLIARW